jgi:hypothetical protein
MDGAAGPPDPELLYDLLADLDRDPGGYVSKSTVAALIRSTWPSAPPGPDDPTPCPCGCGRDVEDCGTTREAAVVFGTMS